MKPRVSVCIPNLNTLPFLPERFESVFHQTFQDWELFVYDSYSDDGSWEFIQQMARRNKGVRIVQGPRQGPYPAWNECVRQTTGEYVYIATSDDSMSPDFLEKMVAALDRHPECELAHAPLVIVDDSGASVNSPSWPSCTNFAQGIADLHKVPHVRRAPYDGLLQLTARHTVLSITQLLIRRSIFSKTGNFSDRWGSVSDFNWEMKAGLLANTVHVPDPWATWRIHPKQLTSMLDLNSLDLFRKFEEMIDDAITTCQPQLPPQILSALRSGLLTRAKEIRNYYGVLRSLHNSVTSRRIFQLGQFYSGTNSLRGEILGKIIGRNNWPERLSAEIRLLLESLGIEPLSCRSCEASRGPSLSQDCGPSLR